MRKLNEIRSALSNHQEQLFLDYPIKSMAIFGSFSRKEQSDESDLDILVEFNDKIGIRFINLANEIENIVGFKVGPGFKERIKREVPSIN